MNATTPGALPSRHSTLFVVVVALFVTDLVISNVIAVKAINIAGYSLQAADLIFPITYILGDVLTEVYGYARARRAIWIGFGCNLFAVGAITLGQALPADEEARRLAAGEAFAGSGTRSHPATTAMQESAKQIRFFMSLVLVIKRR